MQQLDTANDNDAPYTANIADLGNKKPHHGYHCSRTSPVAMLGKVRTRNGTIQYKSYCPECRNVGANFPHTDIAGLDEDRIPFIRIHDVEPCERCGSVDGTELHHWAPKYLFDDADDWPTSYLCRACHTKWHRAVTPLMTRSAA